MTVIQGVPKTAGPLAFGIPGTRAPHLRGIGGRFGQLHTDGTIVLPRMIVPTHYSQVEETDATHQTAGNAAFVTHDSLASVAGLGTPMTQRIKTSGGPIMINVAGTMAATSGGSSCSIDVQVDGRSISGDAQNGVCTRGGEVGSGSGQAAYHAIVRVPPGLHTVQVFVRQFSGGGNTIFTLMNPRGGTPNTGYFKLAVVELKREREGGTGGAVGGLNPVPAAPTTAEMSSHFNYGTGNFGQDRWGRPARPTSAIMAFAHEGEGACADTTSTAWYTWDSIRPVGITSPRFTRRFWSDGGYFWVVIHATFASNQIIAGYVDIAIDGNRLGHDLAGLDQRTQVGSGNLTIAYFGQTARRIPRGWHTAELMLSSSSASGYLRWNFMDASGGSVNDGWTIMCLAEVADLAG